jgi:hypothetical protein
MKSKKVRKFSGAEGSYVLPSQVRTFAETLAGNRDPITEKNFSKEETQQMREAIARSRARQEKNTLVQDPDNPKKFVKAASIGKLKYDPTVGYSDYGSDSERQTGVLKDYSPLPGDAARNTLGRFKYEKTPEGRLVALDSYDFKDDLVDRNPNIPRSKDYEKLSTFEKLSKLAKDTIASDKGGLATLPSRTGSAFVGAASRPVRVDLGEAPFKKGGAIKARAHVPARTSSSKRGDGIAKKGFTKGTVR